MILRNLTWDKYNNQLLTLSCIMFGHLTTISMKGLNSNTIFLWELLIEATYRSAFYMKVFQGFQKIKGKIF